MTMDVPQPQDSPRYNLAQLAGVAGESSLYARLTRHAASPAALVIAFAWGLAEATLFFIVPDVYLGLVALFYWRRGLWATAAALLGAVIGGAVMYQLAAVDGSTALALVLRVPLVSQAMADTVARQLASGGLLALLAGAWQGIPYKVFAVQAAQVPLPFIAFLGASLLARLERFLPMVLAAGLLGRVARRYIKSRPRLVLAAYTLFWIVVYATYFILVR